MNSISRKKLSGVHGLVLTPFKDNYEIDEKALRKEINHMVENGVHVITPVGSTGEFASLTIDEHKKVIKIAAEETNNRAVFIPGTSSPSKKVTLDLMEYAAKSGADAVMVLPPYYYNELTEKAVYKWYEELGAVDIGIIIYNNPNLTNYNQQPELLKKLAKLDNIQGIKEAHGNSIQFYKTLRTVSDILPVIEGCGEIHALEAMLLGADGFYSGVAGFVPKMSVQLYKKLVNKDIDNARILSDKFERFYNLSFLEGPIKIIAYYKAALEYFGFGKSITRPPIYPITPKEKEALVEALKVLENYENNIN